MLLVQTPQQELEALEAAVARHTTKAAGPRGLPIPAFPQELTPRLLQTDSPPPLHAPYQRPTSSSWSGPRPNGSTSNASTLTNRPVHSKTTPWKSTRRDFHPG